MKDHKYHVFSFDPALRPEGGMNDYMGATASLDDAKAMVEYLHPPVAQIAVVDESLDGLLRVVWAWGKNHPDAPTCGWREVRREAIWAADTTLPQAVAAVKSPE